MKSSEPLNVFANLIDSNRGAGVTVLQSSQLTRLGTNCILNNGCGGVTVEKECRAELRGNGIYKNGGHGVSFSGSGQIVENDVVGNRGCGIQISNSADVKVRTHTRFFLSSFSIPQRQLALVGRFCAIVSNRHAAAASPCWGR